MPSDTAVNFILINSINQLWETIASRPNAHWSAALSMGTVPLKDKIATTISAATMLESLLPLSLGQSLV